jgi:hypothetical protein
MMKGIIDRFEGQHVAVEIEGVIKIIKRSDIPNEAREGDVLAFKKKQWILDREETEKIKKEIKELADELWK